LTTEQTRHNFTAPTGKIDIDPANHPYATRKGAIVALATACVLALQMLFAGVAMSEAAAGGVRSGFSLTCATQGKIAPDSSPVAPSKHAHGLCCILHQGALPESDLRTMWASSLRERSKSRLLRRTTAETLCAPRQNWRPCLRERLRSRASDPSFSTNLTLGCE